MKPTANPTAPGPEPPSATGASQQRLPGLSLAFYPNQVLRAKRQPVRRVDLPSRRSTGATVRPLFADVAG